MSRHNVTRRQALGAAGAIVAGSVSGSTLDQGQVAPAPGVRPAEPGSVRLAPRAELVNQLAPRASWSTRWNMKNRPG